MATDREEKTSYEGCLLGAALGNALGVQSIDKKNAATLSETLRFNGLMQITLFTAEGLLRAMHRAKLHGSNGTFAELIHESYMRWLRTQSVDFEDVIQLPDHDGWLIRRRELYHKTHALPHTVESLKSGKTGDLFKSNNTYSDAEGLVRVFPVGLMFPGDEKLSFHLGAEVCALTHGGRDIQLAAGFYAALIAALVEGLLLPEGISRALAELEKWSGHEKVRTAVVDALYFLEETWEESSEEKQTSLMQFEKRLEQSSEDTGFLSYALCCMLSFQDDVEKGVKSAIGYQKAPAAMGMFVGSVLGLINGESGIPAEWASRLKYRDIILQVADDLLTGIKGDIYTTNREWADKYPGY